MIRAIRARDLEQKQKQRAEKKATISCRDKTWEALTPEEKDGVLKQLAIRAGLVKEEP